MSSFVAIADDCIDIRSEIFTPYFEFIDQHQLALIDQELELAKTEFEISRLTEKLSEGWGSVNAQAEYTQRFSDLDRHFSERSKISSSGLVLAFPLNLETFLKKELTEKSIEKNEKFLLLQRVRFLSRTLTQLLEIKKLNSLLGNAKNKLPIIDKQLQYYYLLEDVGTANIQKIAEAEISKLKTQNEITNLITRKNIELSKFTTSTEDAHQIFNFLPDLYVDELTDIGKPCQFLDPEIDIKTLDRIIAEQQYKIEKSRKLPQGELNFSYQSNDSHSGPYDDTFSAGISFSMPLYDGRLQSNNIKEADRKVQLARKNLALQTNIFKNKAENFRDLENSYFRSYSQAETQLTKNLQKIKELEERGISGYSVFTDLTERKLQNLELKSILIDLENRILTFWAEYIENLM